MILERLENAFELGYGYEIFNKPYLRAICTAAFKHAVADIARNTYIYDPDRVSYDEFIEWVEEEERKLEELDINVFDDWCKAMQSYVDCAGGLAPGHKQVYEEIERLIGKAA